MRKTWIKVKRGFLAPKHREAIGIRIWLFLYMLDRANWDTGKISDWTDADAADDMKMPLRTVRDQRQGLEEAQYIACIQKGQRQIIVIFDYVSPRSYDGQILNPRGTGLGNLLLEFGDEQEGDTKVAPMGDTKVLLDQEGDTEGDTEGDPKSGTLPYNHNTHITQEKIYDAWNFTLGELQKEHDRASFQTYINNMKVIKLAGKELQLFIANRYALDWLTTRGVTKEVEKFMSFVLHERVTVKLTTTRLPEEEPCTH